MNQKENVAKQLRIAVRDGWAYMYRPKHAEGKVYNLLEEAAMLIEKSIKEKVNE